MLKKLGIIITFISLILGLGYADLTGAGATFPQPLYSKMFDAYHKAFGVKINYQGIGSGGGIKQLTEKVIDFGGTDVKMNDKELAAAKAKILHVPICLGTIVVAYNLPGNPGLKLNANDISDIFSGKITKWNDPKIMQGNPAAKLPAQDIIVVHRSDSSGTTYTFTNYLARNTSGKWQSNKVFQSAAKLKVGGKGNAGVAGSIKTMPGAIGYVELAYAKQNKMTFTQPEKPITGYSYIIVYKEQDYSGRTLAKAQELVKVLTWMITDGQKFNAELDYGALPKDVAEKALVDVSALTFKGKPLK